MRRISLWAGLAGLAIATPGAAQPPNPIAPDRTVTAPSFRLPPSVYVSDEARKAMPQRPSDMGAALDRIAMSGPEYAQRIRDGQDKAALARAAKVGERYGVTIEATTIAGLRGYWVRPVKPSRAARGKVLVNLPGGGFVASAPAAGGLAEAAPLVGLTGIPALSIAYSQAPEAKFPAASRDVAAVYRELLKTHKPRDIGLFGGSAGGLLTAQALAWFQKEGLPTPGAAGVLCASADARWAGDSWHWFKPLQGLTAGPTLDERFYYGDHDLSDPLMSPMESDAVLKRFPPTLLITATRAGELSAAVDTHRRLVRVGVDAELHVWDGLNHCFYTDDRLPESREAFQVMAKFFTGHLGR
jgi:epsilon-lactone hydrolase